MDSGDQRQQNPNAGRGFAGGDAMQHGMAPGFQQSGTPSAAGSTSGVGTSQQHQPMSTGGAAGVQSANPQPNVPQQHDAQDTSQQFKWQRMDDADIEAESFFIEIPPEVQDPNDPLETVIISIPAFGKGVEHLYGKRSKLRELLKLLNSGGFYRAIPSCLQKFFHPAGEGETVTNVVHGSTLTLQSTSSAGSQQSQTSLTESQRDMYNLPENLEWPLANTVDLLYGRSVHPSQLDITGERKILLRRLQRLNHYECLMIEQQVLQMNLQQQQDIPASGVGQNPFAATAPPQSSAEHVMGPPPQPQISGHFQHPPSVVPSGMPMTPQMQSQQHQQPPVPTDTQHHGVVPPGQSGLNVRGQNVPAMGHNIQGAAVQPPQMQQPQTGMQGMPQIGSVQQQQQMISLGQQQQQPCSDHPVMTSHTGQHGVPSGGSQPSTQIGQQNITPLTHGLQQSQQQAQQQ